MNRGIALLFTLAGLAGVAFTLAAWGSRSYRRLSTSLADAPDTDPTPVPA